MVMQSKVHHLHQMLCLDVFLMGLSPTEKSRLVRPQPTLSPHLHGLLSWDISGVKLPRLRQLAVQDFRFLSLLAQKFAWQTDLRTVLSYAYEALVLTNAQQEICWLNAGFEKMTGYSPHFAIGKTPKFLQGNKTCPIVKQRFREQLQTGQQFREKVVNYRKNGEEYACEVQIFPLRNSQSIITHFLALEKEL